MARWYQLTANGGHVVHRASTDLADHVNHAIAMARKGSRVWLKTRDKEDPLARFYVMEFRLRDGALEITSFESSQIINPDHVMSPPWMAQAATIARRIINPESIGVSP